MFLDFKKWVKSIQTAGYNGARTVWTSMIKCACEISPNNFEFYSLVALAQNSKTAEINVKNLIQSQELGTAK